MKHYDVVVVGGGMAGLTAAATVARGGKSVALCERGEEVGGLVKSFCRQGFVFDCGIHAVENAGTLLPMLKQLGIDPKLQKTDVMIRIGEHTVNVSTEDSLTEYNDMLKSLFPQNSKDIEGIMGEIERTVKSMDVLYGVQNPLFKDDLTDKKYLIGELLPWLARYMVTIVQISRAKEPVNKRLSRYTDNRALIDMISQHFFTASPSFFALGYFWLYRDYYYPVQSTGEIPRLLRENIEQNRGRVMCTRAVQCVNTKSKTVTLSDGEQMSYKKLIWCCNKKSLIRAVDAPHPSDKRTMRQRGSNSVLTLYISTKLPPEYIAERCGSHMFFTNSTTGLSALEPAPKEYGDDLQEYVQNYLALTTYEISCPAVINRELAPDGCSALIVGTLFDYDIAKAFKCANRYDSFKKLCVEGIMDTLSRSLLPDLCAHVKFVQCATPLTVKAQTANEDGAITGWSHQSTFMPAQDKFAGIAKSTATRYKDILQAGQWTFSPAGLPVSIITGKLAGDKALRG